MSHRRTAQESRSARPRIRFAAVLAALAACLVLSSTAVAKQSGTIGWSDDTGWEGSYTIEQAVYPTADAIPTIIVRLAPKRPNRTVVLQVRSNGKWQAEDKRTTRNGVAALRVNPLCEGDVWCDGTYSYRVRIDPKGREAGLVSKVVQIQYVPVAAAAPAPEAATTDPAAAAPVVPVSPPASPFLGCRFNGKQLWGKIYVTDYTWQADAKVFVVANTWQSNLRVQEVANSWQATSCGKWFFTPNSWEADLKIAYVNYDWQADLKVVSVAYLPGLN